MYLLQRDHEIKIAISNHDDSDNDQNWEEILLATNITVENIEDKRYSDTNIYNKISKFGKNLIIDSLQIVG